VARRAGNFRLATWWKLIAAHSRLVGLVSRDLKAATGLALGSYNVLRLLHEAPDGRLRLSELARAVHLTRSGVTRLATRLEKAGILHREEHARDRRSSCAVLTEGGHTEWRKAHAVFVRSLAEHFGNYLSDEEVETLNVVLGRILTADTRGDCQ
jgi:DNA-binding MarR family transcriptional regulator